MKLAELKKIAEDMVAAPYLEGTEHAAYFVKRKMCGPVSPELILKLIAVVEAAKIADEVLDGRYCHHEYPLMDALKALEEDV